jgi:hypothetical protein
MFVSGRVAEPTYVARRPPSKAPNVKAAEPHPGLRELLLGILNLEHGLLVPCTKFWHTASRKWVQ